MKKIIDINFKQLENDAKSIRRKIIEIAYVSGGGQHLGGGLSMVEIMSYVYSQCLSREQYYLLRTLSLIGSFYEELIHI